MTGRQQTQALAEAITAACAADRTYHIMEVCGTHTVSLFRTGVKTLLPDNVHLISGPGCPVCVTPQGYIDAACRAAERADVTICTYGDMVRVPGQEGSLAERRSRGANVVVVYSARDALQYAVDHPDTRVIFLAVGFETTTPPTAAVVKRAQEQGVDNFYVYDSHKLVIPALQALLADPETCIDGFLCPGHVSVIIGADAYKPVVEEHRKPCVIAGFEPGQMLQAILDIVQQLNADAPAVENPYNAVVSDGGNAVAQQFVDDVFEVADAQWRAIGTIPASGLRLRPAYAAYDAARHFDLDAGEDYCPPGCRCGDVIQGKTSPADCPLFRHACSPTTPVGPCMVSSEGTCAAWYKYGRA